MHACAFVDTLPFSCLLGFPWWSIVVVGCLLFVCSWSAGGPCNVMLGVVPAWDRVFLGEAVWGRVGVMGCLWWVSPKPWDKPAGDVLLYLSRNGQW